MEGETTYKMIGADSQEYGPITLVQLQQWVAEGRITRDMKVWPSDLGQWNPAGQYPELNWPVRATPSAPPAPFPGAVPAATANAAQAAAILRARAKSSASWFYWIAGLSLVNTILASQEGGSGSFIFGLGATMVLDAFRSEGPAVTIGISAFLMAVFAAFGFVAHKGHTWAFAAGMVFYLLDGAVCAVLQRWLMAAVHAYVLYRLFRGLKASWQARTLGA